jgi:hypothetical protein
MHTVLERIEQARLLVYEYMHPFVLADKKRQAHGEGRAFPSSEWVLETLAQYAPQHKKYDLTTLDYWQKKGLLRREKARGLLDVTSVAALLITRLAEGMHERNWLPTALAPEEPWWWCYSQEHPAAHVQPVPLPLPTVLPTSAVLWTCWQGAMWEREWQTFGDNQVYRWASSPGLAELLLWDQRLPTEIQIHQAHPLFGRPAVQQILLEEARIVVLTTIVQKGVILHATGQGNLLCESRID